MPRTEAIEIELPSGLIVAWHQASPQAPGEEPDAHWGLRDGVDWDAFESLQVISGAFGQDAVLVASLHPRRSPGHDADVIGAVRVRGGDDPGTEQADETLLSLEYDGAGELRRVGIELWMAEGPPLRVAADRSGARATHDEGDGSLRESTPLAVRSEGQSGAGRHDLVRRG
jgi:hypothetical protein